MFDTYSRVRVYILIWRITSFTDGIALYGIATLFRGREAATECGDAA